jgi:hypothetical protein
MWRHVSKRPTGKLERLKRTYGLRDADKFPYPLLESVSDFYMNICNPFFLVCFSSWTAFFCIVNILIVHSLPMCVH